MYFPVLGVNGSGTALQFTKVQSTDDRFIEDELELLFGDVDSVAAIYDAVAISKALTGQARLTYRVGLTDPSYAWLRSKELLLSGDSLGLAALFLLLGETAWFSSIEFSRCAFSGALSTEGSSYYFREVAEMHRKAQLLQKLGFHDFVMPACAVGVDLPRLENFNYWFVSEDLTLSKA